MDNCNCEIIPLGLDGCQTILKRASKVIFTPVFDGGNNPTTIGFDEFIDGKLPDSYIANRLDENNRSIAWDVTPNSFRVTTPERTATVESTDANGERSINFKGVLKFNMELWNLPPYWGDNLNKRGCSELAVTIVDIEGNALMKVNSSNTGLQPLRMTTNTVLLEWMPADDSLNSKHMLSFTLSALNDEGKFVSVSNSSFESDLVLINSLIPMNLSQNTANANTATSIFVDANYVLSAAPNSAPLVGGDILSKWSVKLSSDKSDIITTAVTDLGKGLYQIDIDSTVTSEVDVVYLADRTLPNSSTESKDFYTSSITLTTGA